MKNRKLYTAAVTAALIVASASGVAQVRLGGPTDITVRGNTVNNAATARGATAIVRAGVVRGDVQTRGRLTMRVENNRVTNRASARGATACAQLGVVDGNSNASRSNGFLGIGGGSTSSDGC